MLIKDAAREAAEDALATHWKGQPFPVDPFAIAEKMGIRASLRSLDPDTSGMIIARLRTQPEIFVEASDTWPRQRFTCAHELGHFVERTQSAGDLREGFAFVDRRTSKTDIHEFYANEFAANLLMPADEVRRLEAEGMTLIRMAGHFGVSVPAMEVRLRRLGIALVAPASR
ncbi:ImmA/IrrE family metallo-endopeptidase [Rhodococcus sp. SGAir0479]|uniref:ImmA/IrrE family metallo-endopeptidase n=1 Tax=Rhodococcus sp. SGAir0479 TaxID=2567884 RepID=UPI0010CCF6A9|nr:ImmA/IrrE family metallo-endopeptidase [Rhodococcus sp. SGAir0479]QCQ91728.1 ImmA/IrrE family metallo-endopeptidase [Rhodococcus sp. SGAir0479]